MLLDGVELTDVVPLGRVELSSLIACMRAGIDQKVSLNDRLVKKSLGHRSYLPILVRKALVVRVDLFDD